MMKKAMTSITIALLVWTGYSGYVLWTSAPYNLDHWEFLAALGGFAMPLVALTFMLMLHIKRW